MEAASGGRKELTVALRPGESAGTSRSISRSVVMVDLISSGGMSLRTRLNRGPSLSITASPSWARRSAATLISPTEAKKSASRRTSSRLPRRTSAAASVMELSTTSGHRSTAGGPCPEARTGGSPSSERTSANSSAHRAASAAERSRSSAARENETMAGPTACRSAR
jgi:hypothetical protein